MAESTWYLVSEDPDRITFPVFNQGVGGPDHQHYRSETKAVDAIKNGEHGETGTLYVLKVELTVAQTAHRGWTLYPLERVYPHAGGKVTGLGASYPEDPEDADLTRWAAEKAPADLPRPDPRDVSSGNGTEFS